MGLYKLSRKVYKDPKRKEYQNLAYRRKETTALCRLDCLGLKKKKKKKKTVDKGEVWTRTDSFFPHLNISPFTWSLPSPVRLWAETLAIRCWPLKQIRPGGVRTKKIAS